jgi:hypothetical protein
VPQGLDALALMERIRIDLDHETTSETVRIQPLLSKKQASQMMDSTSPSLVIFSQSLSKVLIIKARQ